MSELQSLKTSVHRSLARAKERTEATREDRGAPGSDRTTEDLARIRRALNRQRSQAADLRTQLDQLTRQQQIHEDSIVRARRHRLALDQELDVAATALRLERRRCADLESSAKKLRRDLEEVLDAKKQLQREVLEAKDALERLSARVRARRGYDAS